MKNTWWIVLSLSMLAACGDNDDASKRARAAKALNQDIRNIPYGLRTARILVEADHYDRSREVIRKDINYNTGNSKDKIRRIIEGPRFLLMVNEEVADVNISAEGRIQYQQNDVSRDGACELVRSSRVWGDSVVDTLNFHWDLVIEVRGENCSQTLLDEFVGFRDGELDKLHLGSARDALLALDQKPEKIRRLHMLVDIAGDIY